MIINSILNFLKKFLSSALEYKFPSFFAFLFSITSILLVSTTKDYIFLTNIAYASSLGFLLTLVSYFSKSKNILLIIALFLTALYFYSLPFSDDYSKIVLLKNYRLDSEAPSENVLAWIYKGNHDLNFKVLETMLLPNIIGNSIICICY